MNAKPKPVTRYLNIYQRTDTRALSEYKYRCSEHSYDSHDGAAAASVAWKGEVYLGPTPVTFTPK